MLLARYRDVLGRPHVTRVLTTSLVARLPQGMSSLALLLFLAPHVGYARAGLGTGVSVATGGLSNVWLARLVDRLGARPVIVPAAVLYAMAMIALAASSRLPYVRQLVLCAAAGLFLPPVTSVARGLWPRLLDPESAQTVYGLEATAQELVYIAGPSAVALLAALAGPAQAVAATGLVGLTGGTAFAASPVLAGRPSRAARARAPLAGSGVLRYAAAGLGLTACFAMAEVAVVDFVGGHQASATSGALLALWSVGSIVGGLRFGASSGGVTDRGLVVAIATLAGAVSLAAAAPGTLGLAVILLLGGVSIAPCLARLYTRIGAAAPTGATTEAFGWLSAAFLIGASLGSAAAGVAVEGVGPRLTFVLAGGVAALGIVVVGLRPHR